MRGTASAPTARVIDVVELLARPDSDRLRYSDIARELDMTLATTHAILKTLCDRGWATRDPAAKTFTLGPGLASVAAAVNTRPFVERARAAVTELAAELGYAASASEKVGDAVLITAFEGGERLWPGDRIPYAPPFGAGFAAWDTDMDRDAWIRRAAPPESAVAVRLEEGLRRIRDRGFDVDCTSPAIGSAASLLGTLNNGAIALPQNIRDTLDQLRVEFSMIGFQDDTTARPQSVAAISAPILDHHGHAVLLLSIHPLVGLSPDRIDAIGRRLVETTTAITGEARLGARGTSSQE